MVRNAVSIVNHQHHQYLKILNTFFHLNQRKDTF